MGDSSQLLIFDLDGTLVDSARDIAEAVNILMQNRGRPLLPEPLVISHIGEGLRKLIFGCFPESLENPQELEELERQFIEAYGQCMFNHTKVYDGIVQGLQDWNGQLAIVTNKNERQAHQLIARNELAQFNWRVIYGGDTFPHKKPHPLPLVETLRQVGVSTHQALMIGDGTPDVKAARAAGIRSLAVGYGYSQVEQLKLESPDHLVMTVPEVFEKIRMLF